MKVSLELLYHYRCDQCQSWWSVADIYPARLDNIPCPHCAHMNAIESINYPLPEGLSAGQNLNLGFLLIGIYQKLAFRTAQETKF